uniref:Uncharacterized protein n=1 Tax=Anguilla anguilla TaxID=7936 RepID=A0A0E9U7Z0_ANGAN
MDYEERLTLIITASRPSKIQKLLIKECQHSEAFFFITFFPSNSYA